MKSGEHFDVIIIGAGPSGIFCAYELIKEKPELNILMIEKGTSGESYNLMAKLAVLRYNAIIPTG